MKTLTLIATSTFGLEAVVRREVEDLGFSILSVADGKVEFTARVEDIPKANIWLRAADRVLLKLGEFRAVDFDALFEQAKALPWENWITQDGKIDVVGKSVKSRLRSVRACQSIVKKAVVERLKKGSRKKWLSESGPEFTIQVALLKDVAQLTLDTSGEGLHRRGYRRQKGEVPLRENLAAALVVLSCWKKEELLLDPMCGSGTILIEAALLARNIAPGLNRNFAAEKWPAVGKKAWERARSAARAAIVPGGELRIFGYDIDQNRIRDCRMNAKMAGVANDIVFRQKDIKDLQVEQPAGVVITNPPYGIKLSNPAEIKPIYQAMNDIFRGQRGWSLYVLTSDRDFPKHIKRSWPDKVRKLYNGTIMTNFYQYYGESSSDR